MTLPARRDEKRMRRPIYVHVYITELLSMTPIYSSDPLSPPLARELEIVPRRFRFMSKSTVIIMIDFFLYETTHRSVVTLCSVWHSKAISWSFDTALEAWLHFTSHFFACMCSKNCRASNSHMRRQLLVFSIFISFLCHHHRQHSRNERVRSVV